MSKGQLSFMAKELGLLGKRMPTAALDLIFTRANQDRQDVPPLPAPRTAVCSGACRLVSMTSTSDTWLCARQSQSDGLQWDVTGRSADCKLAPDTPLAKSTRGSARPSSAKQGPSGESNRIGWEWVGTAGALPTLSFESSALSRRPPTKKDCTVWFRIHPQGLAAAGALGRGDWPLIAV